MRVGVVGYTNTVPLAHGLEHHLPGVVLVRGTPAAVAGGLHEGTLDVGLTPVAALADHPGWPVVPGLGIASFGPVRSVLLLSKVPPERVTRLVLDPASRTSNVLAQLWLEHRAGARPEVLPGPDSLLDRLEVGEATVAIGDEALFFPGRMEWTIDLGGAWTEWTGLPFVFAVWAGPRADAPWLAPGLAACYRENSARIEELAAARAPNDPVRRELLAVYWRSSIRYHLGVQEAHGLARFLALGARSGYFPRTAEGSLHVHLA